MSGHEITDLIAEILVGDAKNNALAFVEYLSANEMFFERGKGYWQDKYYWSVKFNEESACFILISNEEKNAPESWTVWSDDSGAAAFGDSSTDEETKEILCEHVVVCEKVVRCFDGCKRSRKVICGKEIDNVCGTAMKFENPNAKTVECMKKMIEIRKNDIQRRAL